MSPIPTLAEVIIALLTLTASLPPPAGMTFEVNSAEPIVPRTRCCLSPPRAATWDGGTSATARPLPFSGFQCRIRPANLMGSMATANRPPPWLSSDLDSEIRGRHTAAMQRLDLRALPGGNATIRRGVMRPEQRRPHRSLTAVLGQPARFARRTVRMPHRLPRHPLHVLPGLIAAAILAGCSAGGPSANPTATAAAQPSTGCEPSPQATTAARCGESGQSTAPTSAPLATPAGTPVSSPGRDPGAARRDAKGIGQVWVPGGVFQMGADSADATPPPWARNEARSERPQHEVAISRGYWIDTTEVTVEAYEAFIDAGGYQDRANWSEDGWAWLQGMGATKLPKACVPQEPDEPQVCVTWYEADAYARWRGGRLPTEAEWEFAARGPESRVYPWGNEYDPTLANLDGGLGPGEVGSHPKGASWVGALDMAGNAMEWVGDWWSATYYGQRVGDDPTGPATGSIKVEKGGWWGPANDSGAYVGRAAYRHFEDPPLYSDHH